MATDKNYTQPNQWPWSFGGGIPKLNQKSVASVLATYDKTQPFLMVIDLSFENPIPPMKKARLFATLICHS